MNMEYVLFDVVIAALLILAVVQGYKRGFVLTLCGFLAVFVALIGAAGLLLFLLGMKYGDRAEAAILRRLRRNSAS